MRHPYVSAAIRCGTLLIVVTMLAACGAEEPREIVISRPLASGTSIAVASSPVATNGSLPSGKGDSTNGTASTVIVPTIAPPTPLRAIASPTLSAKVAEYEATVKYWYASYDLLGDILIKYNRYAEVVQAYNSFDDYKANKASIISLADQFNAAVDANTAKIAALDPPAPAVAYHNAMLAYWQAERAYISDLRQAIDRDDVDLWNQGSKADRQQQLDSLNAVYRQEQAKLVNDYINKGAAK